MRDRELGQGDVYEAQIAAEEAEEARESRRREREERDDLDERAPFCPMWERRGLW